MKGEGKESNSSPQPQARYGVPVLMAVPIRPLIVGKNPSACSCSASNAYNQQFSENDQFIGVNRFV